MQTINEIKTYTFQAVIENSLMRFSERPCCNFTGETPLTYAEVNDKIVRVKKLLSSFCLKTGDRVVLYARNSPHWIIAYLAIVSCGLIAVPLLPDFSAEEVARCIEHVETNIAFVEKKFLSKVNDSLENIIQLDDFEVLQRKDETYENEHLFLHHVSNEDDIASIIYTSGTTGRPKGVVLTNKNLVSNAIVGQYCYRVGKYDRFLSILPLAHVYEFTVGFMMPFLNGAHIVYLDGPPIASLLLPALQMVKPNIMLAVPLIMEKIYKSQILPELTKTEMRKKLMSIWLFRKIFCKIAGSKIKKALGGRIQFFGLGGSKLDTEIEAFLKCAGFPYAIGYGLTETAPLIAYSSPSKTKPGALGFMAPSVEGKLINVNNEGIGELVVKGINVMQGYYKDPERTQEAFTDDGFFRTGDLFSIEKNGRLTIRGRLKNMILNASGENIYPEDIEFVLNQSPLVSESLVVEDENSSLTALIKLNEEKLKKIAQEEQAKLNEESVKEKLTKVISNVGAGFSYNKEKLLNEIKFFVNSRVNARSKIHKVEIVDEFEKTASGKIKRYVYNLLEKTKKK